jgi:hypothetical protein
MPNQLYDEAGTLLQKTRAILARDQRSLLELANETGLPFYWLRKFAGGKIKNPSVNRIQYLYEKLTRKKL